MARSRRLEKLIDEDNTQKCRRRSFGKRLDNADVVRLKVPAV